MHGFCVSRKGGTGGDGWGHRRVVCTWWLVDVAVKGLWLGLGGPPLALTAWTGLKTLLSPCRGLVFGKEGCLGSESVYDK